MAETLIGVFSVSLQENRFLVPSHGLIDGDTVKFKLDDPSTGALPFPLNEADLYHVVGARGNDFQVSDTPGGPIINVTDKGVGSNEVWKQLPGEQSSYMLKFIGTGNFQEASIGIYGDGITKDVTIDLTKPPFSIDWRGFYPKNINIENIGASAVKTVTLSGSTLVIIFDEPPPATDWSALSDPLVTFPKPGISFKVHFIYGTGLE